jgi:hypothetical protein
VGNRSLWGDVRLFGECLSKGLFFNGFVRSFAAIKTSIRISRSGGLGPTARKMSSNADVWRGLLVLGATDGQIACYVSVAWLIAGLCRRTGFVFVRSQYDTDG